MRLHSCSLAQRFVDDDRGGDSRVQRFDRRSHRNGNPLVGLLDPRRAFHPNGSAQAPAAMTLVAEPASAARTIAPRLPGSWTSLAITTSGAGPAYRSAASGNGRRARATIVLGDRTGLSAAITCGVATATSTPARSSCAVSVRMSSRSSAVETTAACSMGTAAARASASRWGPSRSNKSGASPRAAARY